MEFQIGEIVLYGAEGICTILGTEEKKFDTDAMMYYVLESQTKLSRIFVPFANELLVNRIRRVLSAEQMQELLSEIDSTEDMEWIANDRERKAAFASLISNGKTKDLLVLMKTIQNRRKLLEDMGKKLYAFDDRCYRDARALVVTELTLSLRMTQEDAGEALSQAWTPFGMIE